MQGFDQKKADIQSKIDEYAKKKADILSPKPPPQNKKQKIDEIVKLAVKSGLQPTEVAERLGVDLSSS